jgi:DNA-binding GntR family transcriptional regulator
MNKIEATAELDNEQIRRSIFEAIVDHRMAPGTHLKEDVLCEVFGVGRTRVRAVLARLAADHVVDLVANRGAFVSTPTIEEAREVFRARRLIEAHLVRRVADRAAEGAREALRTHLDHERAARAAGNQSVVIKRCTTFHQVLAEQADSPIVARFLRELIARSALIVAVYESRPPDDCEFDEHNLLTELVLAGQGDEAARLMEEHLEGIEGRLDLRPRRAGTDDLRSALLSNR